MRGPTRRRVLKHVSTGAGTVGAADWIRDRTRATEETARVPAVQTASSLEVSILETGAPVSAGEYLDVTAEIRNTGSSAVRTDVDFLVGEDPERFSRIRTTLEAGETRTTNHGFHTFPVPTDDEFPVRVEVDGDADERTASVTGASWLSETHPGGELAVEPGTEILFEATPEDPDEAQQILWWVDGDQVSAMEGPWGWAYRDELGTHFHRQAFETAGSHYVAAAIIPRDREGTYTAHWQVDVTEGGLHAPTVEAIRPDSGTVPMTGDESVAFELEARDPADSLERVVWWLTQADVILDVTDLEGTTATAQLLTDATCHTCHVVPWVICSDGTVVEPDVEWQLERVEDADGPTGADLELSIRHADSPVDAGEYLEVIVDIENTGDETGEDVLELVVGHDPEVVDTQEITVEPGTTGAATLGFETYPTRQDETFPIRVVGADDAVETTVQVFGR